MKKTIIICLTLALALLSAGCHSADKNRDLVNENIDVAQQQLTSLLAQSEQGGQLRIPSTYKNGAVEFVPTDDWVSGFFAGSLWYMYALTGNPNWRDAAERHTALLDSVQYLKWHHDVGFMINSSYGNELQFDDRNQALCDSVMVNTARSLSTRFRPAAGIIQSWNVDRGWQSERGWKCPVIIDNMMNLELLFKATQISGDSTFYRIAVSHADRTMKEHFRPDFSSYHVVDYDPETGEVRRRCTAQGYSDESAWARGQAWALYGYTVCYRYTMDERYLKQAEAVFNFILRNKHMPEDLVPYWDFDAPKIPNEPRDVSTAAIIASALYELYTDTQRDLYKQTADHIMTSLSSPDYRARVGENGGFLLMHSVGSLPHSSNIDVPLNYADYYFLEALLRKQQIEQKVE